MLKSKKRLLILVVLAMMLSKGVDFCRGAGFVTSDEESDYYDALPLMPAVDGKKLLQAVPGGTSPKKLQAFQAKIARLNKEINHLLEETRYLASRINASEYAIYEKEKEFYGNLVFNAPPAVFSDSEIDLYRRSLRSAEQALQEMNNENAQNNSEASIEESDRITKAKKDERNSALIKILKASRRPAALNGAGTIERAAYAAFRPIEQEEKASQLSQDGVKMHVRRPIALSPKEALIAVKKMEIANAKKELIAIKQQEVTLKADKEKLIKKQYSRSKWVSPLEGTDELARERALKASRKEIEKRLETLEWELDELM